MAKAALKKIGQFWLEVSVVMIGVAITLSVSYWIERTGEKKDMALYMRAIRLELEENDKMLDKAIADLRPVAAYSEYLQANEIEAMNRDTLESYSRDIYSVHIYSFKTNAFEMFKNSGSMRLLRDKQMLLSLWSIYDNFDILKELFDWYHSAEWDDMRNDISLSLSGQYLEAPMYEFYATGLPRTVLATCENVSGRLKEFSFEE